MQDEKLFERYLIRGGNNLGQGRKTGKEKNCERVGTAGIKPARVKFDHSNSPGQSSPGQSELKCLRPSSSNLMDND